MANEITIALSISVTKNGATYSRSESFTDDMSGDSWTTAVVDITTSGLNLHELQVGTHGWMYVKNLSSGSDFIDIGWGSTGLSGGTAVRLYAGESTIFKSPGNSAIFADADTSTQALEYAIIEL